MSQVVRRQPTVSPDEYLAMELAADVRHEYVGGYVYALAGAARNHNRVVSNLHGLLWAHLVDGPCELYGSDMKVRPAEDLFYYADVMVCCDPTDNEPFYTRRPRLVFEVMSASTRRTDQNEKSAAYWALPTIDAYVLVEQDVMAIQVRRRATDGWQTELLTEPTELLRLDSIGFSAPLSAVYARTEVGRAGEP